MLQRVNFVWKFLSGLLMVIALLFWFHPQAFSQGYTVGGECAYLPAGEYYLEVIDCNVSNGEGTVTLTSESLVTPENKQGVILFEDKVSAGKKTLGVTIFVPQDARNVVLRLDGGEIGGWHLQSMHLMCYDNYFLMLLFFMLAIFVWLYGSRYYRKEHNHILCLIGVGLLSSLPFFGNYLIRTGDLQYHLARINGIYEGIRTGQFPVLINPVQLGGYGYATGTMYPQLFLYIPALLKFLNISTFLSVKLLYIGTNLATAFLTYYAVRRLCSNSRIALMSAVMFTLNPYRLSDLYSRNALGEILALAFLPLVLWGTYEILWGRKEKWWILVLGMTGVLGSHILSLEFDAMLIFFEIVLWMFSKNKNQVVKRMLTLGKATLSTIVLNLYFIGPFLRFMQEGLLCFEWKSEADICTVDLIRLFAPLSHWSDLYLPWGSPGSMPVTLGSVLLVGIIMFLAFVLQKGKHESQTGSIELGKRYLILGSVFLMAATWVTPWEWLMSVQWLEKVQIIEFPWRLLGPSALLFCIVAAIGVEQWEQVWKKSIPLWLFILCGLLLDCGSYYEDMSYSAKTIGILEAEGDNTSDDSYLVSGRSFFPGDARYSHIMIDEGAHLNWIANKISGLDLDCEEPETVEWSNFTRDGLNISVDVFVKEGNGENVEASFPLYHYPGYSVLLDGEITEQYPRHSLVTCEIPPGEHHIEVTYTGFPLFRFCYVITLCSAVSPALWYGYRKFRRKSKI